MLLKCLANIANMILTTCWKCKCLSIGGMVQAWVAQKFLKSTFILRVFTMSESCHKEADSS